MKYIIVYNKYVILQYFACVQNWFVIPTWVCVGTPTPIGIGLLYILKTTTLSEIICWHISYLFDRDKFKKLCSFFLVIVC